MKVKILEFIKTLIIIAVVGKVFGIFFEETSVISLWASFIIINIIQNTPAYFLQISEDEEDYIRRLNGDYNDERKTQKHNI